MGNLISYNELFKNKDDLITRESVIYALLSAFSIKDCDNIEHKLNKQEIQAFLNILNIPKFKIDILFKDKNNSTPGQVGTFY